MKNSIFSFLSEKETHRRTSDIAVYFRLSTYQARYYLTELEKEGRVKRSPLRRGSSILWEAISLTEETAGNK